MSEPRVDSFAKRAEEVFKFRTALTPESDRGCALMAGAFLDERLRQLIEASLIVDPKPVQKFLGTHGPLGSFASRIDYVYLAGLVGKSVHKDLHLIRAVRNQFGHSVDAINFTTPEIRRKCDCFENTNAAECDLPRIKFTNACFSVLSSIDIAILDQAPAAPKLEKIFTREEKDKSRENFLSVFQSAVADLTIEEIGNDPESAKARVFARVVSSFLKLGD